MGGVEVWEMALDHSDEDKIFNMAIDYLENRLDDKTKKWYKKHILQCNTCLEEAYRIAKIDAIQERIREIVEGHIKGNDIVNFILIEKWNHPGKLEETFVKHLSDCKYCSRTYNLFVDLPYEKLVQYKKLEDKK